jgi:hypothetical protein
MGGEAETCTGDGTPTGGVVQEVGRGAGTVAVAVLDAGEVESIKSIVINLTM